MISNDRLAIAGKTRPHAVSRSEELAFELGREVGRRDEWAFSAALTLMLVLLVVSMIA